MSFVQETRVAHNGREMMVEPIMGFATFYTHFAGDLTLVFKESLAIVISYFMDRESN